MSWRYIFEVSSCIHQIYLSYTALREEKYWRFRGRKQHKFIFAHIACLSFIGSVLYFIWSPLRASDWCTLWLFKTPVNRSEERQDKGLCFGSYVIQLVMTHITSVRISVTREHPLVMFRVAGKWPLPMLGGREKWDGYQLHSISVYQRWIKNWLLSCYHGKNTRYFNIKPNIYEHLLNFKYYASNTWWLY